MSRQPGFGRNALRVFLPLSTLGCLAVLGLGVDARLAADEATGKQAVYFGTYTGKESKGIYRSVLDLSTGELSAPELAAAAVNPSFLAIHPSRKFLYAVGEIENLQGKKQGGVSAFAIGADGKLKLLNQESSEGGGPCHAVVDATGKAVLVANYGGGSVASLPINADGSLNGAASAIQHKGSSVIASRQKEPHAHSINLDGMNRFAFAADLGLDKVLVYRFDPAKGTLATHDPAAAAVAPGSGPRHFAFHPSGKSAYVINELANTVTVFQYDAAAGVLKNVQVISTLPENWQGASYTAEVQVHPSGKFVYGSNRGHDSLAIFTVGEDGKLTAAGHQPTGGKTPRNFGIDPSGAYILAANQNSGNVVVFKVDLKTGALKPTGSTVHVGSPVCVKFLPL